MSIITVIIIIIFVPLILLSFIFRNQLGSAFGPTVCSRCGAELRGWKSSGRKQVWYRTDENGKRVHFCARCKNKYVKTKSNIGQNQTKQLGKKIE
jgi:DNA-directed RNA polymerase subunit RPC12/RpoP